MSNTASAFINLSYYMALWNTWFWFVNRAIQRYVIPRSHINKDE